MVRRGLGDRDLLRSTPKGASISGGAGAGVLTQPVHSHDPLNILAHGANSVMLHNQPHEPLNLLGSVHTRGPMNRHFWDHESGLRFSIMCVN